MKRHQLDVFSLIGGAIAVAIGVAFIVGPQEGEMPLTWLVPTLLLGSGVAIAIEAVRRAVGDRRRDQ